jgi:hypothetical protein
MQEKKEGERVPEGVSYSESTSSFYLRVRNRDTIHSIRILKSDPDWEVRKVEPLVSCTCDLSQGWVVGGRDHAPECPVNNEKESN